VYDRNWTALELETNLSSIARLEEASPAVEDWSKHVSGEESGAVD